MKPILTVTHLSKQLTSAEGVLTILDNISFSVSAGSATAIMGASGSGKTTLLSLLAGLDVPTSGDVVLNGVTLNQLSEDERAVFRAGRIGFVFQNFQLLLHLTALENVMLPLELAGDSQADQKARQILEQVGLAHRLKHYPNQLSGGEQQRCAIARAYVIKPTVLFADEPTGNLDQHTGEQVMELLFHLNQQQGTTLIMATHDQQLAQRCHEIVQLDMGHICS